MLSRCRLPVSVARAGLLIAIALLPSAPAAAGGNPPAAASRSITGREALRRVQQYLNRLHARFAQVEPITDEAVTRSFPTRFIISVWFRSYPVAMVPPAPLKQQNLFVVDRRGAMTRFSEKSALRTFILASLAPAVEDAAIRDAVRAWLTLSEQLLQDGFYRFAAPDESITVHHGDHGTTATGKAVVTSGGRGDLTVRLEFDAAGRLLDVAESGKVLPGVRPICQATKLLDRDPIVRRMAEQDLLVMGRAVEPYLQEQRARARPALRRAIDRIRRRIVQEGR